MSINKTSSLARTGCFLLALIVLCGRLAAARSAVDTPPPQYLTPPVIHEAPVRNCPQVATITFTTDEPTRAELGFTTSARTWRALAERTYSTTHSTLVLGMLPDTQHQIRLRVIDLAGNATVWPVPFEYTTPALPQSFPPLHVTVNDVAQMEPGLTLLPAIYSSSTLPGSGSFVILVDEEGQVVWFYGSKERLRDVTRLRNGNLLCMHADERQAFEIDPLGNVLQRWWAANLGTSGAPAGATMVAVDTIHHEFSELPPGEVGDFVGLSSSHRLFPDYPVSETDPTQTEAVGHVAGTVIFEMQRDGTVVRSCDLLDVLDPYRICYGSLANIYAGHYGQNLRDWSHANSVILDRSDDTWIVSVRHQDAIVKIRRSDHSIVWIHGAPDRWTAPWSNHLFQPAGIPFDWHLHQHAAQLDTTGRLTMFDNGNFGAIPPTPQASQVFSRAVAYQLDPITQTTQEVWSWDGGGQSFYSGSLGSAYPLPHTGNVILTAGNVRVAGQDRSYAKIQEVSGTMPAVLRFELLVNDPLLPAPSPYSWTMYRTRRVTGIYPHL